MPRPPCFFTYLGGKFYLAKNLIPLFPKHNAYIDVFGGAGNVLIQKPRELSQMEVYNDVDSDIVNIFRQLRENEDEFIRLLHYTPYSREHFEECLKRYPTETDPLQRAVIKYTLLRQGLTVSSGQTWGIKKRLNTGRKTGAADMFQNAVEAIPYIANRLRRCQIENLDFRDILKKYDFEDAFFYCDPPYLPETRKNVNYVHEMTIDDHEDLVRTLKDVKGKVMLSGYPNELYDSLGWNKRTFDVNCMVSVTKQQKTKRTEVVWMNYEILSDDATDLFF